MEVFGATTENGAAGGPGLGRVGREPLAGRRRVLAVLALTLALLLGVEFAAQLKSHWQTGQSVLTRWTGQSTFVHDPATGLRLLRPNAVIQGDRQVIRTNSLGLRSDELPAHKQGNERRIVVIGSSSVMGAYARSNQETLPALVERQLRADWPHADIHVLNAGIVGYGISEERRMLEFVVDRLKPDLAIVYAGVNDFSGYCRRPESRRRVDADFSLPQIKAPDWLLSFDLLRKNSVELRAAPKSGQRQVDARSVDISRFGDELRAMARFAQGRNLPLVFSTNARSYRPDQDRSTQEWLARSALYYNTCFDVQALNILYERHNALIRDIAAEVGARVIPLGEAIPGGAELFQDANHFNAKGNARAAGIMADFIERNFENRLEIPK